MKTFQCKACRRILPVTSKNPEQQYCSRIDCQRARKRAWQRKKRDTDPDYRQNQVDAQKRWLDRHPDYWRGYRKRSQRSPPPRESPAAKMDGLSAKNLLLPGEYLLTPVQSPDVKMDAIRTIIIPISTSSDPLRDDIIGKIAAFAYDCLQDNGLVRTPRCCSP